MHTPDQLPWESCTSDQIAAWMVATEHKRLDLHLLFAEPWHPRLRELAFLRMSDLVQESIEEVRVITETRHANSEALRARATALCAQSTALCAQSAALCAHSVQIREQSIQKGPTPEEIRAAEQPLLNRLKDSLRAAVRGPRAHDPSTERAS